jgi:membrane protease YdiL (CAAX protease family)
MPMLYVAGMALAEVATRTGNLGLGLTVYAITLIVGLNQAATTAGPERALLLAVAVVLLERLLSLTVPFVAVGPVYWNVLVAVPTLVGIALVARLVRYSRQDLGLVVDRWVALLSLALVPPGLALGLVYYWIVRPLPLVDGSGVADVLPAVAVLALTTGLIEEMLFRGLVQRAASSRLGPPLGILYVGVLYTLLAAVPWSVGGIALVFAIALCLAALTSSAGSVVPAAAYHASLNVGLLLAAFVRPGGIFS